MGTEAEARAAVALSRYEFDYLRFVKDESTGPASRRRHV